MYEGVVPRTAPDFPMNHLQLTALCLIFSLGIALSPTYAEDVNNNLTALPATDATIVAFDTETTGLSPSKDRIIEIGAVKIRNGKVIATKGWLINPQQDIPSYATRIHGISNDMVADQPVFAEVYPEFKAFIGDSVLVAHNARFDVNFVSSELNRQGLEYPDNQVLDSLKLFRKWYPELKSHKLGSVAGHLGVKEGKFHRAVEDTRYLARIFLKSISEQEPSPTLGDLSDIMGMPLHFTSPRVAQTAQR